MGRWLFFVFIFLFCVPYFVPLYSIILVSSYLVHPSIHLLKYLIFTFTSSRYRIIPFFSSFHSSSSSSLTDQLIDRTCISSSLTYISGVWAALAFVFLHFPLPLFDHNAPLFHFHCAPPVILVVNQSINQSRYSKLITRGTENFSQESHRITSLVERASERGG